MRIAFLTSEFPTERQFAGGLASYLRRVSTALNEGGHDAEVFTLSDSQELVRDGLTVVHRVPGYSPLQAALRRVPYVGRRATYADIVAPAWNLVAALYRRHRERPFDVVQASNYRACGLVAALRNKIPVVTRISSYEPAWRTMYRRPLTKRQARLERAEVLQVKWSAAAYAPSHLLAQMFRTYEGLDVRVIEPPFSLAPPDSAPPSVCEHLAPESYALFFGFLGYLKGCDRLVNVLPGLLERNPDMNFVFVGPTSRAADRFDDYIRQKLQMYLGKRVFVLGEQRHAALVPLIRRTRLVVLPSRVDNLPNACMEAMALGRVVIGTYGASFEQLIQHEVNGFLVSQDDDQELGSTMERVWRMDGCQREVLGRRAAESLDRLRPEKTVPSLVEFLDDVISRTATGSRMRAANYRRASGRHGR